ncbi:hypothetical protein [Trichothermofontia sp.]
MQDLQPQGPIEVRVLKQLRTLPVAVQQQVLDFLEFLAAREQQKAESETTEIMSKAAITQPGSFLELTQEFAGCLEGGPVDLSVNKKFLGEMGKY